MALVVTVGGETSDSYVSVAEADTYFANHYSTAKQTVWEGLSSAQKESVLRRACQQLETLRVLDDELATGRLPVAFVVDLFQYDLTIHRAEIAQRLQFPRNLDITSTNTVFIPQEVKDSQCEQAVHLLSLDDSNLLTLSQGIIEDAVTAGAVRTYTKYSEGRIPTYLSPMVIELMRPFLRITGRVRRA
jgi:hypothetical protein